MSSSESSRALDSTMQMAFSVPATRRFNSLFVFMSVLVGLMWHWPSQKPTRTAPTGVSNGMSEMHSEADAPIRARVSDSFSRSADHKRALICVSQPQPSGKSGRIGRSIRRQVRISFSFCRPSRLKKPPGILPAAKLFSR